jgi:hypothetical protein
MHARTHALSNSSLFVASGAYDFNDNAAALPGTAHGNVTLHIATEYNNTFGTFAFTQRAIDIIHMFSPDSPQPLFLYLAFQNVRSEGSVSRRPRECATVCTRGKACNEILMMTRRWIRPHTGSTAAQMPRTS